MRRLWAVLIVVGCTAVAPIAALREEPAPESCAVEDERPLDAVQVSEIAVAAAWHADDTEAPRGCRATLAARGVRFDDASPSPTIVDPIKVAPLLGDVTFRHVHDPKPRWLWVDCRFALRLHAATDLLRARGVREVLHVGTYEPKCVGGGTPESRPGCTPSAHALGMAIDVVSLVTAHDDFVFERDFVKRGDATPTCETPRRGARDTFLKELVCALDGTFNVLLTPNWDDRHKTHVHLALHPTAKAWWANGVDPQLAPE
ncbi:MAG: extensin family protein [Deltaproteobacteria bacterium]|nr:extensin family protein [Deltaproteobacteria bacterium]